MTLAIATVLVPGALAVGRAVGRPTPAGASQPHVYSDAGMIGFGSVNGSAPQMPQPLNSPVFSGVATPDGGGYLLASARRGRLRLR